MSAPRAEWADIRSEGICRVQLIHDCDESDISHGLREMGGEREEKRDCNDKMSGPGLCRF